MRDQRLTPTQQADSIEMIVLCAQVESRSRYRLSRMRIFLCFYRSAQTNAKRMPKIDHDLCQNLGTRAIRQSQIGIPRISLNELWILKHCVKTKHKPEEWRLLGCYVLWLL
jgi:hypothetical protein